MKNKICVYAICKNESQFVEKWYNSVKEADCVVVLDTGSTDDTFEKLKKLDIITEQKIINPWRFDVARNESMKLIPEDCNILVCLDFDEIIEKGWANVLRERWIEGTHKCCWYKYVWSHLSDGSDGRVFWTNKIHSRGYKWEYPIHETLAIVNDAIKNLSDLYIDEDGFKIHHYSVFKESRSSYLQMMEIRAKENPDNFQSQLYLFHQYFYEGKHFSCISKGKEIIDKFGNSINSLEQSNIYFFIGRSYSVLGNDNEALDYLYKGIEKDKTYIENYLKIAEIYLYSGIEFEHRYERAYKILNKCLYDSERHYSWLEGDDSFDVTLYDLLSISAFYGGKRKESLLFSFMAKEYCKNDERLNSNFRLIRSQTTNKDLSE